MSSVKPVSDRPRSQQTHARVLDSTRHLMETVEFDRITVEKIASHSGVSTATIYKHWPSKFAVIAEAFGRQATERVPVVRTDDPVKDLVEFAVASMTYHGLSNGRRFVQLLSACAVEPGGAAYLHEYFLDPRRQALRPLWDTAVAAGRVRDLDFDLALDVLFGATVFRMLRGQDDSGIRATVEASLAGLLR